MNDKNADSSSTTNPNSLDVLATSIQNDKDLSSIPTNSNSVDNMKLFLLVYAKSNLERIVKLTEKLNQMEDQLVDRTINDPYIDLNQLMSVINLIHGSVDRSVQLIKQVTSDESYLNVVINNAQIINNAVEINNESTNLKNNFSILKDKNSRHKVITATTTILAELSRLNDSISDSSTTEKSINTIDQREST